MKSIEGVISLIRQYVISFGTIRVFRVTKIVAGALLSLTCVVMMIVSLFKPNMNGSGKFLSEVHGVWATYYASTDWSGVPVKDKGLEEEISDHMKFFRVAQQSQEFHNQFSCEWIGYLTIPETADYTFATASDDGSWLWIDERLVVDNGGAHGFQQVEGHARLKKGAYPIRIRYSQIGGEAILRILWAKASADLTPLPMTLLTPEKPKPIFLSIYRASRILLPLLIFAALLDILYMRGCFGMRRKLAFDSNHQDAMRHSLWTRSRLWHWHGIAAVSVLTVGMYFSTGTLAPYANTTTFRHCAPMVEPTCQYLYNEDYYHFHGLFSLLDGDSRNLWENSVYLRRILYNLLAYPLMKYMGHDSGGIITNVLLTWGALIAFHIILLRRIGVLGTVVSAWLFALYPGIMYFIGQPFLHNIIVPACLWLYLLLHELESRRNLFEVSLLTLGMGMLFLGYDLIVFFGVAAILLLLFQKRYLHIPVAIGGMLLPNLIWGYILTRYLRVSYSNENNSVYGIILKSYWEKTNYNDTWLSLLQELPRYALDNFFFSTFLFLPMFLLFACWLNLRFGHKVFTNPELLLILTTGAIFLFNNMAPPYPGWQMRGDWIARLYQPIFVVWIMIIARTCRNIWCYTSSDVAKGIVAFLFVFTLIGHSFVTFGPISNDPSGISSQIYWRFYRHSPLNTMKSNLAVFGRRPLGFCRPATDSIKTERPLK